MVNEPQNDTPIINVYDIVAQLKLILAALIEGGEIDIDLDSANTTLTAIKAALLEGGEIDIDLDAIVSALGEGGEIDIDLDTLITNVGNVATAVGNLATAVGLLRWGYAVEPVWYGGVTNAPGAGATLATRTVAGGKTGHVFGVLISSPFADVFTLYDNAVVLDVFNLGANGQAMIITPVSLADVAATHVITIKCTAGGAGDCLAKLLESET